MKSKFEQPAEPAYTKPAQQIPVAKTNVVVSSYVPYTPQTGLGAKALSNKKIFEKSNDDVSVEKTVASGYNRYVAPTVKSLSGKTSVFEQKAAEAAAVNTKGSIGKISSAADVVASGYMPYVAPTVKSLGSRSMFEGNRVEQVAFGISNTNIGGSKIVPGDLAYNQISAETASYETAGLQGYEMPQSESFRFLHGW